MDGYCCAELHVQYMHDKMPHAHPITIQYTVILQFKYNKFNMYSRAQLRQSTCFVMCFSDISVEPMVMQTYNYEKQYQKLESIKH